MRSGMRLRIHQLHHERGRRKVSDGEAEDYRRGGYTERYVHSRFRKLRRDTENSSGQVASGTLPRV